MEQAASTTAGIAEGNLEKNVMECSLQEVVGAPDMTRQAAEDERKQCAQGTTRSATCRSSPTGATRTPPAKRAATAMGRRTKS